MREILLRWPKPALIKPRMLKLGVNIDHVATVRQARRESFPDPTLLAIQAWRAGADGITAHLREDRRHIQDSDIRKLKRRCPAPLNLEMSISPSVLAVALRVKPAWACLVPEKRQELTTEGGLNLNGTSAIQNVINKLHSNGIRVSLFVDASIDAVRKAKIMGADAVELHTGRYAECWKKHRGVDKELNNIISAAHAAQGCGLIVNAGHGLDYVNVRVLARRFSFNEFNIGFSIVARALEVGMTQAVKEMKKRMFR